jgi:hypothetical protein
MLRSKVLVVLVALLFFVAVFASPVWADQAGATAAISSTKNTIVNCYGAAEEAEAVGANITALVATLNDAGALLSQAELAYAANDFDAAVNFAVQSQSVLNGFVGEANALKETAVQQQNQDFLVNVVGSIIGSIAVIIVGGLVWLLLKRKYETVEVDVSESEGV